MIVKKTYLNPDASKKKKILDASELGASDKPCNKTMRCSTCIK